MNLKKVLFLDRDGTIIKEPEDYQIDSFEKLEFLPNVFQFLGKICRELDYEIVMITNQDGLGTPSFPEATFWPVQNKMLQLLSNEGIHFDEVFIDRTFAHENAPTRKPGTGLLGKYLSGAYNLKDSFVIGDRLTDMALAKNLGAKGIWINSNPGLGAEEVQGKYEELKEVIALTTLFWSEIYQFLKVPERKAKVLRTTKETDIMIELNLDGKGKSSINTGIGFFDHMLDQLAKHSSSDLSVQVKGDLHIDEHHTVEDTAIALGEAFHLALADKAGIERYGFCLPMDDCLAQVAIDFGGRNWIVWDAAFKREKIGEMPTEMFFHFFKSFSDAAKCNLNVKAEGENEHHKIESIFKAFAKSIKMAKRRDPENMSLPSTKGIL